MPDSNFEQELIDSIINKNAAPNTGIPDCDLVDVSKIMSEMAKLLRKSR